MKKETKINLNICPKCNSRATKFFNIGKEFPNECQLCKTEYSEKNYLEIKKEEKKWTKLKSMYASVINVN